MNMIQESFLQWLHQQRDHQRLVNYTLYDGYYNGDHEIDIPVKVEAALESELGTVNNYCRLVVDASVDYIAGGETSIEVKESPEAEAFLYEVYKASNLLTLEMLKTITVMGKKGDVFLKLYIQDGVIKIVPLRPDICFPRYKADDYREMLYCAVQWFEEPDAFREGGEKGTMVAQVFRPDVVEYYELESGNVTEQTQWVLISVEKNLLGFIPIIHIKNTIDDLEFGTSDIQIMSDLQDALNKTITDMLLTMDNQAFQRAWVFGAQAPKGEEITMEPGKITEVPNEQGHVDVIESASIEPFIEAMRDIVEHICTVSQISKMAIIKSDAQLPESGFALRMHFIPQERKAGKKIMILQAAFAELNQMIFEAAAILKKSDYTGLDTEIHFSGGLPIDEVTQLQVDEMEIRNEIRSKQTIMQRRGVEDVERERVLIKEEKAAELAYTVSLAAATTTSVSPPDGDDTENQ